MSREVERAEIVLKLDPESREMFRWCFFQWLRVNAHETSAIAHLEQINKEVQQQTEALKTAVEKNTPKS